MVPLCLQSPLYRLHVVFPVAEGVPVGVVDRDMLRTHLYVTAHLVGVGLLLEEVVEVGDEFLEGDGSNALGSEGGHPHLVDDSYLKEYFAQYFVHPSIGEECTFGC